MYVCIYTYVMYVCIYTYVMNVCIYTYVMYVCIYTYVMYVCIYTYVMYVCIYTVRTYVLYVCIVYVPHQQLVLEWRWVPCGPVASPVSSHVLHLPHSVQAVCQPMCDVDRG